MLVLSRRAGEKVVIPQLGIVITVLESKPGVVRLGIDAPQEIRINRAEVQEAIEALAAQGRLPPVA